MEVNQSTAKEPKIPSSLLGKLADYGLLIGYAAAGVVGLGTFAFKIIMIRQQNMANKKNKSKVPIVHYNMRNFMLGGLLTFGVYTYGLVYLLKQVPENEINIQMRDYQPLSPTDQRNPQMQEHYIFKTMRMFKVSEELIKKAEKEFSQMNKQEIKQKTAEESQNLNSEVVKSLWEKWKWEAASK